MLLLIILRRTRQQRLKHYVHTLHTTQQYYDEQQRTTPNVQNMQSEAKQTQGTCISQMQARESVMRVDSAHETELAHGTQQKRRGSAAGREVGGRAVVSVRAGVVHIAQHATRRPQLTLRQRQHQRRRGAGYMGSVFSPGRCRCGCRRRAVCGRCSRGWSRRCDVAGNRGDVRLQRCSARQLLGLRSADGNRKMIRAREK